MFLEDWVCQKVEQRTGGDITPYSRGGITNRELEQYQLLRLKKTLHHAFEKSAFYRDLFRRDGISPEEVQSLEDLKRIPFTESVSLAETPYKFLCIPLGEIARVFTHTTSGTTGSPKKIFFTEGDIDAITECMGAITKTAALCAGLPEMGWVVQIFMPDGLPMSQAKLIARGVEREGSFPVIGDITSSVPELVEAIDKTRPDILMGSVSRLYRITQEALQYHNIGEWGVKVIFITSEYLSKTMRKRLKTCWDAEVYHHYGMTELGLAAGIECEVHNGFHLNEADLLVEVVDPTTGKILGEGEEGELVFTTLSREGMPLIRYRTADLATLSREPCACGACTARIGPIARRIGSTVRIGATGEIYPSLFEDVLYAISDLIEYRVLLVKERNKECLILKVEATKETDDIGEEIIQATLGIPAIRESVEANLLSDVRVEFVERGTLRRVGRVKQRIVDNR